MGLIWLSFRLSGVSGIWVDLAGLNGFSGIWLSLMIVGGLIMEAGCLMMVVEWVDDGG